MKEKGAIDCGKCQTLIDRQKLSIKWRTRIENHYHRGTQEIGGNCVELEQDGQRIVLDVGIPIQSQLEHDIPLPSVAGFENSDPSLLAVLISHPHLDHYGLLLAFRRIPISS